MTDEINEYEEVKYEFLQENKTDLINEFVEIHKEEFEKFLKNEIVDEVWDIEHWKNVFCEEEFEEEFNDYVNDSFSDYNDATETQNSLINDLCRM